MILRNLPHEVTIIRAGAGTDEYGNAVEGWATATETTVRGWLQQTTSDEEAQNDREVSVTRYRLFLGPDADLRARDRVRVNGVVYSIDGEPEYARSLNRVRYVAAGLERREG